MLVTVGWYMHPFDAHIARGLLESEGIPAFLHSIHHASINWTITLALGGIRLQVPAGVADEAIEVLEADFEFFDAEEIMVCPACASVNIVKSEMSWRLALFAVHLLNIPLPFRRYEMVCKDCSARWH